MQSNKCAACGIINFAGKRACKRCGADLSATSPTAPAPWSAPAPPIAAPASNHVARIAIGMAIGAALGVFLIAALGLGAYQFWWKRTPQYSVYQIESAVESHNLELFRRHVDLDSVIGRFFDDAMARARSEHKAADSAGQAGQALGEAFAATLKPQLVDTIKRAVERFVETGAVDATGTGNDAGRSVQIAQEQAARAKRSIESVARDGNIAIVDVKIEPESGPPQLVKLKMRQLEDGHWQLAEIANASDLMAR